MPTDGLQELSWVMRMNDNLKATRSVNGGDATATISPVESPTFFRVPIPLREVSEESYTPKFAPLGLYSHAARITNSSIHIKFRKDFTTIFIKNTRKDWDYICSYVMGNEDWVKLWGDFKLEQQGEDGPADAPRREEHQVEDGRGRQDVIGTRHPNLSSTEEIKVLLALDTVFVVCFIQGDHQRVCNKKGCPTVIPLNQEMKKEALFPLVHLIRVDLFKFENQIPLRFIKKTVEMIIFEGSEGRESWTNDKFKKFLVDAVDLIYCLPGPRERWKFRDVLEKRVDFGECLHLLQCLYLVVCFESESAQQRRAAIVARHKARAARHAAILAARNKARADRNAARPEAGRTSEMTIAQIWNHLQRWLTSTCTSTGTVRNSGNNDRTARSGREIPGDTRHSTSDVIDLETGNSGNNQDHSSVGRTDGEIRPVQNSTDAGTNALAGNDYRGGAVGQGQVLPAHDQASESASHEENASSRLSASGENRREEVPPVARAEQNAVRAEAARTFETIFAQIWNLLQMWLPFFTVTVGNSGNNDRTVPSGRAMAQGSGDTGHSTSDAIDLVPGNLDNNQGHSTVGRTDGEIQLVQNSTDAGTNAPAGSDYPGGALSQGHVPPAHYQESRYASHEENASPRLSARGENSPEEVPPVPSTTFNRRGDGRTAANGQGHVSQAPACGWLCFCKRKGEQHRHMIHIPTITELRKAGIKVEVGHGKWSTNWISEVNFKRHKFLPCYNGTLYLPQFSVYDETEILLRNLLAYEYVVERKKDLLSYIHLMDNLINTEEDVKLMRDSGVLKDNRIGSDKLLADMWNKMLTGFVVDLNATYVEVFDKVTEHYENGCNRCFAEFYGLYLARPWLFGGAVVLLLTAVATIAAVVFTVLTYYYGNKQRQTT